MVKATLGDLAAHLGEGGGARAVGVEGAQLGELPFEEWAWQFCRWDRGVMVRAALTAARLALSSWEGYVAPDGFEGTVIGGPRLRGALDALEGWLSSKDPAAVTLAATAEAMRSLAARVSAYAEEASGDAATVSRRAMAVAAALSTLAAVETAAWEDAALESAAMDEQELAELQARRAAGPALHVVEAFSHSCAATGMTADQLRAELRRVFLVENP